MVNSQSQALFTNSEVIAALAFLAACVSLFFSFRSWQVGKVQAQAALFTKRFTVFTMTKKFLVPWFRDGKPDLRELHVLIDAWGRSKFLFDDSVTSFLRQMWKDAVQADLHSRIVSGELEGDRDQAIEITHKANVKYLTGTADEPDLLVETFKSMKVNS